MKRNSYEMNEKEIVNYLLLKEREMSGKIHYAITEILRHGYDTDRGRAQIPNMLESMQLTIEDIERTAIR